MIDADYAVELLVNTSTQIESQLRSLVQAAGGIGFNQNANKTEFMCYKQEGTISTLSGKPLNLVVHIPRQQYLI